MKKNWNSAYMVKAFARLPFDVMLQQKINAIYRDDSGRFDIYRRACGGSVGLQDGWLYSKDMAYMDRDGYIFLMGRDDDVINTGGNAGSKDYFFLDNLSALGTIPTADDQAARLYIIGRRRGVVIHWDRATAARCAEPSGRMGVIRECRL